MTLKVTAALLAACGSPSNAGHLTTPSPSTTTMRVTPSPTPQPTQRVEPELPEPREETAAAALDGKLYVMAGFDASGGDTSSVFVYSPSPLAGEAGVGGSGRILGGWQAGPRLPVALDHPSAATLGGRLYLSGGYEGGLPTTALYTLAGDHWRPLAAMGHPRSAHSLIPLGDRLYALGGVGPGGQVATPEVYEPESDRWQDLPPIPLPRNHVAGFVLDSTVCVAGGRAPNTARTDCFDPNTRAWSRLADLPIPTSGAGGASVGGTPVVGGGELASEGGSVIDQLARYRDGAWRAEVMLEPRHGFQLALMNGRAWACGGASAPGLHPVATCTSIA